MTDAQSALERRESAPSRLDDFARRLLFGRLAGLAHGSLTLVDGDGAHTFGDGGELAATLTVHDGGFYGDVASGGSVGAGESYMRGAWSSDDLVSLVRLMARNMALVDGMEGGLARITAPARRLFHLLHHNTRRGSRRNIGAHYDLGNELFELFLDRNMMYSSAVFEEPAMSLDEAARAKLERICRKLELGPDDHVLEIGTGWGGFALHAAARHGCRVTTTTISTEQYELALERVHEAGLEDRVTVLKEDYRDLRGSYDKLVSIEMIEAVGHRYLPRFFERVGKLLADNGMMLLQAITIADQRYRRALREVDFIQRYIFPGGFLPSVTAMTTAATQASDLRLFHLEDIGAHYARTLAEWRRRFMTRASEVRRLGYPGEFVRMWEFYLAYCEGGFEERAIGAAQMLFVKPRCRRAPITPALNGA